MTISGTADEKERELPLDFLTLKDVLRRIKEKLTTFYVVIIVTIFQKHITWLFVTLSKEKLHKNELLKPFKMWKDLVNYLLGKNFNENVYLEMRFMIDKGIFKEINRLRTKNRPISLKWIFDYKFDENGYLERCKLRLVMQGDL